ncbi:MAG: hypothetical protein HC802_08000 [Caldilineaceae bacterium]|nr:hypothetical protein [Caldilineaceae bacterium]
MDQLRQHAGEAFSTVLANDNYDPQRPPSGNAQWVELPDRGEAVEYRLFTGDLIDNHHPWRHDSQKVAARLIEVYETLRAGRAGSAANL